MSIIYSFIDRAYWVYQPNFVRTRQRFRGVRESEKANQEIGQYHYDVRNMSGKITTLKTQLEADASILIDGGAVPTVSFSWEEAATPSEVALDLIGFDSLAARVERIRNRTRSLEGR